MKHTIYGALVLSMLLAGCTKEKPYKEVPKHVDGLAEMNKAVIDTNADYLYAPSTLQSDRKATSSRPYWSSDAKRVRFVFTDKDLKVIEPEKDGRFSENPTSARSVLSLPISHIDYKCAEDDFGKCTHKEEESKDIPWNKKKFFILKADQIALQQFNYMPMEIEKFFGSPCTKEVRSEFVKVDITEDAINLILEKTFQDACPDFSNFDDVSDLSYTVRYQHTFVKMNKIVSPDYKPIRYTRADEGNFGFFSTQQLTLDVDNNDVVGSEKYYFDRFNPERKEVIYYLSPGFKKPENAAIRKATEQSVTALNDGLSKAGAKLRIKLEDAPPGMSPGDIRYSMIVMEEEPQAAGLIGYGPHAANPLTGEIISARTIMYLGTMKKYLKYNYDELLQAKLAATPSSPAVLQANNLTLADSLRAGTASRNSPAASRVARSARSIGSDDVVNHTIDVKKLEKYALSSKEQAAFAKTAREKVEFMSKNCMMSGEMVNLAADMGDEVDKVIEEVGAKPWIQLSEAEKEKVIAVLLPFVWTPTLIHEMGHNLGLRHNFAGSEDSANFYTPAELAAMGLKRPAQYSSVMDYAFHVNNELRVMGKYDIAALRYGYAEKVETADGKIISLAELRAQPATALKAFGYCTDEHVAANPNCNRFDEGTNLLEIAQHYVKAYNERYARGNMRNNRRKFSMLGDSAQIGAIDSMMSEMRLTFERYESIKNTFDLADNAPEWESIPFLKELKAATLVSGQFFLDVIKTPDLLCAVSKADNPTSILALLPIRELSKRAISCFDKDNIQLNPAYVIVAEGGKSFTSRKDPGSDNPWADQVDVRGIWMDKMLATHYLLARELGSSLTDQYTENFLHLAEMQGPILSTIEQVLTDELAGPVSFRTIFGPTVDLEIRYKLFDVADPNNSHKLPAVMDPIARLMFGLPEETSLFHQKFVNQINSLLPSQAHSRLSNAVLHQLRVYAQRPNDGRPSEYTRVDLQPGVRVFVHQDSALSLALAGSMNAVQTLGQLTPEQQAKVLQAIADNVDTGLDATEAAAKKLGKETMEKFQQGGFQQPGFYALMLQTLAR